ncbi:MAG: uroporphyrinogen decarboxylase family protein [Acutalibacteraceae bacterium]
MNSKEKVIQALNHVEGPIPLDFGGTSVTGIHCLVLEKLRQYYGLPKKPISIIDPYQMLGFVDEDLKQAMGVDTDYVWGKTNIFGLSGPIQKEWKTPWGQSVLVTENFCPHRADNGEVFIYTQGDKNFPPVAKMPVGGYFFNVIPRGHSFDEEEQRVEENLEEFGFLTEDDLTYFENQTKQKMPSNRALIANIGGTAFGDIALVPGPMLKEPKGLRDISEWYMATVLYPDYIRKIFDKQLEIALENLKMAYNRLGDSIQVVFICGTDFGTQNGPFCSIEQFESLYAPYYKAINNWIHQNTGWKTFKHSCGSIMPILPALIESGFDIINPVQWTAKDMDAHKLKEQFGKQVVFWGGGVDTQKTFAFGTPDDVKKETLEMCKLFGKGGGFVCNTIHNVQANTPPENVAAFVEALNDYNRGTF